ncbi:MAG: MarC family protein [Lentisphaeria bacterium]|nr:MarC family protein [Lentisphaeria bacterium]
MMFFFSNCLKFLFLMTPFFVLSMFLSMTLGWGVSAKKKLAIKVGFAALIICLAVLFGGKWIFEAFGITLDAFRIGGGAMLFLSAIGLVNSNVLDKTQQKDAPKFDSSSREISKIAVVPLAIPVTVGPATIAPLLIASAEAGTFVLQCVLAAALVVAVFVLTIILILSSWIEDKVGINVVIVLSKLTGLILAAMASQMIFTGIINFVKASNLIQG